MKYFELSISTEASITGVTPQVRFAEILGQADSCDDIINYVRQVDFAIRAGGTGLTWNEVRVRSIRHRMALPAFDPASHERTWLSLDQAATYLGVSTTAVRSLIKRKVLAATQVSPGAPWQLPREAVASPEVASALATQAGRSRGSRTPASDDRNPMIPGL